MMDFTIVRKVITLGLILGTIYYAWRRNIPRTLFLGLSSIATMVLEV